MVYIRSLSKKKEKKKDAPGARDASRAPAAAIAATADAFADATAAAAAVVAAATAVGPFLSSSPPFQLSPSRICSVQPIYVIKDKLVSKYTKI